MSQQAYIGRNIANNSAQPMQGVGHNLVQSQPNLTEQLVYNNLGQSAQIAAGSNNDFNNLLASHQPAQSPDKKSKQTKRHQNHSQNNRESGHGQGARFGSQNNNGSQARNNQAQSQATPQCQYHMKPYVAFCIIHNELVCEEC